MKRYSILFFIFLTLTSCSFFTHKTYTWDWRRDHDSYHSCAKSIIIEEAPSLLETTPKDIENYRPGYAELSPSERLEFWSLFLSIISWMESSHRAEHFYEEIGITDSSGENVISRGLLQFSFESARGYYSELETPEQLHEPETALRVGILALQRFISEDNVISQGRKGAWKGAARYWSVLRKNDKHDQIKDWLTNANYDNPRNNLIPLPPHLTEEDAQPGFTKFLNRFRQNNDAPE